MNIEQFSNEDLNRLADFILKPGGPADAATQRAIDMFVKEGMKFQIAAGAAGDLRAYMYVYRCIAGTLDEGEAVPVVPGSMKVN